jgi:hypothetical protein
MCTIIFRHRESATIIINSVPQVVAYTVFHFVMEKTMYTKMIKNNILNIALRWQHSVSHYRLMALILLCLDEKDTIIVRHKANIKNYFYTWIQGSQLFLGTERTLTIIPIHRYSPHNYCKIIHRTSVHNYS